LESKFRHKTTEKSIQRLQWLKQKHQLNTNEHPRQQTPNNTEHNQNKDKDKKHRRFVKHTKWRNLQKKKKSKQITAIYNYSTMTLTSAISKVLNRGLNLCVTPTTSIVQNYWLTIEDLREK
jgi:Fic family protein